MSGEKPSSLVEKLRAEGRTVSPPQEHGHKSPEWHEPMPSGAKATGIGEDEVSMERWLVSYADFITLLMVLFMMLYALQLVKSNDVAINELRSRASESSQAADAGGAERQEAAAAASEQKQRNDLLVQLASLVDVGAIKTAQDARGVEIDISAAILFNSGEARLLPPSKPVLQKIAAILKKLPNNYILVEGHTDSAAISTAKYESNWELSSARAGAVVRFLVEQGIEPHRLSAMGRADNVPAAIGQDPESMARNRRVTLLVQY